MTPTGQQITDQVVSDSVMYDPDFAPTIAPDMTIDEYRRARQPQPRGRRLRRGLSFAMRGAMNAAAAGLSSS